MQDYGATGKTWIHCAKPPGSDAALNTHETIPPQPPQLLSDYEQTARDVNQPWVLEGRQDATIQGPSRSLPPAEPTIEP